MTQSFTPEAIIRRMWPENKTRREVCKSKARVYGGVREGLPTRRVYNVLYEGGACGEGGVCKGGGGLSTCRHQRKHPLAMHKGAPTQSSSLGRTLCSFSFCDFLVSHAVFFLSVLLLLNSPPPCTHHPPRTHHPRTTHCTHCTTHCTQAVLAIPRGHRRTRVLHSYKLLASFRFLVISVWWSPLAWNFE